MSGPKPGLVFYPASHRYKLDGEWVPGVTTIIGVLDKSGPLSKWAATTVAEFVADEPGSVEALRTMGRESMVAALKGIPWTRRDDKAGRGTTFHALAQQILLGHTVEVPPEQVGLVESALAFMEAYKIDPTLVEVAVGSRAHKYAGTADLIANDAIWDWKTGKRIYSSVPFQLSAYAGAEFFVDADGNEHPMPPIEASYGVHIREDGYSVHPLKFGPEMFAEFLVVRAAFDIHKRAEGDWKIPGTGYVGAPHITEDVA